MTATPLTFEFFVKQVALAEQGKAQVAAQRLLAAPRPRNRTLADMLAELLTFEQQSLRDVKRFERSGAPIRLALKGNQFVWLAPATWKKRLIPVAPRLSLLGLYRLSRAMNALLEAPCSTPRQSRSATAATPRGRRSGRKQSKPSGAR